MLVLLLFVVSATLLLAAALLGLSPAGEPYAGRVGYVALGIAMIAFACWSHGYGL